MKYLDIGVKFDKPIDTSFMDDIMESGIADSGLDSRDFYFNDDLQRAQKINKEEFDAFLESHGINPK